jgi:hypothetical protein
MKITAHDIANNQRLAQTLAAAFDIDFARPPGESVWFTVKAPESFLPFATEGAGGVFLQGAASDSILYVTSEGKAGIVAASLAEFLQLVIAYPNWVDLLKFSGGGQLGEMERVAPYLEREFRGDDSNIQMHRDAVMNELSLDPAPSPISALHHAVATQGKGISVLAPDGSECGGLFGSFVVEDNPMWRGDTGRARRQPSAKPKA